MCTRIRPFTARFGWDDGLILVVTVSLSSMSPSDLAHYRQVVMIFEAAGKFASKIPHDARTARPHELRLTSFKLPRWVTAEISTPYHRTTLHRF